MKFTIAMLLFLLAFTVLVKPAEAQHSFWHRVKDQMSNRHGWQYGYGSYPTYNNYRGSNWGHSNPWGTYGAQQGWGHQQGNHHEYEEHHGYHHD